MLNPFIDLISNVILLINMCVIVWVLLGLLLHFDIMNRGNPLVQRVYGALNRLCEPMLRPIRNVMGKFMPDLGGIDLSPVVLILLLQFINNALYEWFFTI